jgi:hypothetical protein
MIVIHGGFTSPWSYLASRRVTRLELDGVEVDWRAVEHDRGPGERPPGAPSSFDGLREEMEQVVGALLPGERLPYSLAGFVPHTGAAIDAYAAAYAGGSGAAIRQLLFEAFWVHAFDLADAQVVHTLVADACGGEVPGTDRPADPLLSRRWAAGWPPLGTELPVLVVEDTVALGGAAAVEWLGHELMSRGVHVDDAPLREPPREYPGEEESRGTPAA